MAIIHLGCLSPNSSSDLPEDTRAGSSKSLPIWSCTTRSLPSRTCCQMRRCALTAPFHPSPNVPGKIRERIMPPTSAGLFSVALVVTGISGARTLSGSLPYGVRTFLFPKKKRLPDLFNLQGFVILPNIVGQIHQVENKFNFLFRLCHRLAEPDREIFRF